MRPIVALALLGAAACSSFGTTDGTPTPADGGAGDAGPTARFCERYAAEAGAPAYCRDFDDGTDILFDWDDSAISPLGSVTLGGLSSSPPSSLKARLEADAGACAYARVTRYVDVPGDIIHVEFAVRVGGDGTSAPEGSTFFTEEFGTCRLILSATDKSARVQEQFSNQDIMHGLSRFPKDQTWTRYVVEVNRKTRALDVSLDGVKAFTTAQTLDAACDLSSPRIRLLLGQYCEAASASPREIHLDDVVAAGH